MNRDTTVIIGAGPYGLSAAAHLKAQHIPTLIFGKPMRFWKNMPAGMFLKSSWSSLSLADPARAHSLDYFSKMQGIAKQEPVPLQLFLDYTCWFQRQVVPEVDETYVRALARDGNNFRLELADGRSLEARRVVVASGIAPFAYIPTFARGLPPELASHTQEHRDFSGFQGKQVVVVGRGQSAFEAAASLYEAGAKVELIARGPVIWIDRRLYRRTGPIRHLFYPPSDVGPAGISWIVSFPQVFRRFPEKVRNAMDARSIRPAVAPWMRPRVEGRFKVTPDTSIVRAEEQGEQVRLALSDGSTRQVDHILLGTGYRPDVQSLSFLDGILRQEVVVRDGYPVLNKWFESSVPHLYFVGSLAGYTFGPLCRFVTGAGACARQVTRHAKIAD